MFLVSILVDIHSDDHVVMFWLLACCVDALTLNGMPALPSGQQLQLETPGWALGYGTGGRLWPAAGMCDNESKG